MKYSNIKSPFIKTQLKKTNWADRRYIDDLIHLHNFMIKGVNSYIAANLFSDLKFRYQEEYLKLIQEDIKLNPNEKRVKIYPKIINYLSKRNKKNNQSIKDDVNIEFLLKKDWTKSEGMF